MQQKYKLILGSGSPRRRQLLGALDVEFEVIKVDSDEGYPRDMPVEEIPEFLAKKKAKAALPQIDSESLLITADTLVIIDGKALGKPQSRAEAIEMLQTLSGRVHRVITGVALTTQTRQSSFSDTALVRFEQLELDEIEYYIDRYQPFDKAGGYGIQEWIGFVAIGHIEGDFNNVMGLPTQRLYKAMKEF